jgi:hypothetical protein
MRRLLILAALALAGCPAAHSDYPSQSCKSDNDCYLGEHCKDNSICVPNGLDLSATQSTTDMSRNDGGGP